MPREFAGHSANRGRHRVDTPGALHAPVTAHTTPRSADRPRSPRCTPRSGRTPRRERTTRRAPRFRRKPPPSCWCSSRRSSRVEPRRCHRTPRQSGARCRRRRCNVPRNKYGSHHTTDRAPAAARSVPRDRRGSSGTRPTRRTGRPASSPSRTARRHSDRPPRRACRRRTPPRSPRAVCSSRSRRTIDRRRAHPCP